MNDDELAKSIREIYAKHDKLENDSAAFQSHCHSCGVPWESHMGIAGICAENAQLKKERDQARVEQLERTQTQDAKHERVKPR